MRVRALNDRYDLCIIDCGPSLGLLMLDAIVAATDVIIPVQVYHYAFEGIKRLLDTVRIVAERFYPCSAQVLGILLTFVEDRASCTRQIQHQLRESFGDLVFDTVIHRTVVLIEAPGSGQSVLTYAPPSRAAAEYRALADETMARLNADEKIFAGT